MPTYPTKSAITRSWPATFTYLGIGLAFVLFTFLIFKFTDFGLWLGTFGVVLAIAGVIFFGMAYGGAGVCPCPACGKTIEGLSTGKNDGKACEGCHRYFEGENGELWATDESRVADSPRFASSLPENFNFPKGCCVCGKSVSHREKISMTRQSDSGAVIAATTGVVKSTTFSVEVPHCDEHKEGASLTGTKDKPKIAFRPYPYLRAFCELNGTMPG